MSTDEQNEKCRVLIPTIYRDDCPTVHSRFLPLCKKLVNRGFEFTFLVLGNGKRKVSDGIIYEGYANYLQLIFRLLRTSSSEIDLLYACKPYTITGLLAFFVAKVKGLSYLLDIDDRVFPSHIRKWWRLPLYIQEWASERFLIFMKPTTTVASRALESYVGKHAVYIPNSADLEVFNCFNREFNHDDELIIIWPVVFFQETDRRYIVDIFGNVLGLDGRIKLLVVGDGECLGDVKSYAAQIGALNTQFVGRVAYENMTDYYARASAGILPLRDEHYDACKGPIKLYEFMAMGLPVIATDIGEPAAMIKASGCGLILPFEDSRRAAEQLVAFMQDKDELCRTGKAGRKYLEEKHNFDLFAEKLEQQLRSAA